MTTSFFSLLRIVNTTQFGFIRPILSFTVSSRSSRKCFHTERNSGSDDDNFGQGNFSSIEALLEKLKSENPQGTTADTLTKLESLIKTEKQRSSGILQKFRLDNQVALVTGGSRGIGFAIAQALGEAGCKVAIASQNAENVQKAAAQLRDKGIETLAIQADVSKKDSVEAMIKTVVNTWGQLHIAVNNAGIAESGDFEKFPEDQWDHVVEVNLKGVFLCCQIEAQHMLEHKYGRIINIGSVSGHVSAKVQNEVCYEVTKAGVIRLTKSVATEWADKGITVNCISPGYINTDMNNQPEYADLHTKWLADIPMKRFGEVEELCGAAILLASSLGNYTTGSDMIIDGGLVLW